MCVVERERERCKFTGALRRERFSCVFEFFINVVLSSCVIQSFEISSNFNENLNLNSTLLKFDKFSVKYSRFNRVTLSLKLKLLNSSRNMQKIKQK